MAKLRQYQITALAKEVQKKLQEAYNKKSEEFLKNYRAEFDRIFKERTDYPIEIAEEALVILNQINSLNEKLDQLKSKLNPYKLYLGYNFTKKNLETFKEKQKDELLKEYVGSVPSLNTIADQIVIRDLETNGGINVESLVASLIIEFFS